MIKEILQLMYKNHITLNEIANELSISRDKLINRLGILEHLGYITIICNSSNKIKSDKEKTCKYCTLAKTCLEAKNKNSFGIAYQLTEKGKRVVQKTLKLNKPMAVNSENI